MTIGLLRIHIFIPDSNSLKAKRMVLHSLKARLRNSFNVAVTQVDQQDKWQRATLAVVGVEQDIKNMDSILSRILNFIEKFNSAQLIDYEIEMI
ncbi:DUF503 domain-containing protein [bacterium]|nr:MAG: DUF503 domain-containing protein [bacterium]